MAVHKRSGHCKTLIICRTILSNQKSCGVLRFQECLGFRWNWQKQRMFVRHEFSDQRSNVLDLHLIWLGQVSFFHRRGFVQRDPRCRAVWWNWLTAVLIDSHKYASLTWTKLDVFSASKACWRMDSSSQCDSVISIDFHRSRCASFFALKIW